MSEQKTFLGVELSSSKKVNALTFTALVLLIFSLIGGYYVSDKRDTIYPPMYVDSSPSYGVVFNINHALYRTDRDGTLIEGLSFKTLGLKEVADIKFFNGSLLVLQGDAKVKRCELPLGSCREFASAPSYRADIYMRIIPSKNEQYFYVIQTNKSKIDKFDKEGKHLYRLHTKQKNVKYPRGGIALNNDTLILADTGHKRVIALQDKGEDNATVIWSFSTKNPPSKSSYSRVLDVKLDAANNIWITNTDKSYEKAYTFSIATENIEEISKINTDKANHIQSQLLQYPGSITAHRDGMLIADENTFKLLYADNTSTPTQFGDGYIQTKLKKIHNQKTFYQDVLNILIGLFGLAILMAIVAAIMEMPRAAKKAMEESGDIGYAERKSIPESKRIEPDEDGIVWLLPRKKILKQLKWLNALIGIAILFMIYQPISLLNSIDTLDGHMELLFESIGLIVATMLFLPLLYSFDYSKYAIGVDETHLFIHTGTNKKAMDTFENVVYLTRQNLFEDNPPPARIAINNVTIPLMHGNEGILDNSLFDKEQFGYYIKPKLKFSKRISWNEMLQRQIKGINLKMWILLSFVVIVVAISYIGFSISK